MSEAQETFQAVGEKLASRRIYDEMVDREGYMPEDAAEGVDPADNDEEMAKKLGGEKRLREEERKIFAKFALKSVEFKEEEKAEEEQDGVGDRECDIEETDEEEIPEGD